MQLERKVPDFLFGYFDAEIECAKAYDKKAKEVHGDKAILNFE